jgi:cobaltochelatase CobT
MSKENHENLRQATLATIKAIADNSDAELTLSDQTLLDNDLETVRALADTQALQDRYHDIRIQRKNAPLDLTASEILNALEKARYLALGAQSMQGVAQNLQHIIQKECRSLDLENIESHEDIALAQAFHIMGFISFSDMPLPPEAAALNKHWQSWLNEKLGKDGLAELANVLHDQEAFAQQALELIKQLDLASDGFREDFENDESKDPESSPSEDEALQPDSEQEGEEEEQTQQDASEDEKLTADDQSEIDDDPSISEGEDTDFEGTDTEQESDFEDSYALSENALASQTITSPYYNIYTSEFDEIVRAEDLAEPEELERLRNLLDHQLSHLQGVITKLANRLQRQLMAKQQRSWKFDQDEGVLDGSRLARIVANPNIQASYKQEDITDFRDTIVTLLIDNSGSMRGRPIAIAAMCTDILARTLERCDVKVEILGFTTRAWKGGKSRTVWVENDRPHHPGRLNDIRHIIYKSASMPWRRARQNIGLMMKEGLLKENIDGEAIVWAYNRLAQRPERRKIMIVISDGAPVDDSTLSVNPSNVLEQDLKHVIQWVEQKSVVELTAIGIGHDVNQYYTKAMTISDAGELAQALTDRLSSLFSEEKKKKRGR